MSTDVTRLEDLLLTDREHWVDGPPHELFGRLRSECPVHRTERITEYPDEDGFWSVTTADDVHAVSRDWETYSSERGGVTALTHAIIPLELQQAMFIGMDPPKHDRLKALFQRGFTPKRIAQHEPEIRAITTEMIDRFAGRGHADLVTELAFELPALVIFRMLGVPAEDVPKVKAWAQSRVAMNFGDAPLEEQIHHAENLVRYWRYCQDLVRSRLEHPQDDLPGALAALYASGEEEIELDEIAGMVYGQLTAGHETTTALLSNGLKELLADRDAWDAICADPGVIRNRLKIEATVYNAGRLIELDRANGGIRAYLHSFPDYWALEKAMKKEFKYLGNMGTYLTLFVVGEDVPDYHEWREARPMQPRRREPGR